MDAYIKCPKCGERIPMQEAMQQQMQSELAEKLKGEQERMDQNAQEIIRSSEERIRKEVEENSRIESKRQQEENERLICEQLNTQKTLLALSTEKQQLQTQLDS